MYKTDLTIQDQMRAQYTKRWTTVHLTHDQSMAEHSFNVAILAVEIARRMKYPWDQQARCMAEALYHDIDEVITGDIPTPTKRRLDRDDILDKVKHDSMSIITDVVKAADTLETTYELWQHKDGRHADTVLGNAVMPVLKQLFLDDLLGEVCQEIWNDLIIGERTW